MGCRAGTEFCDIHCTPCSLMLVSLRPQLHLAARSERPVRQQQRFVAVPNRLRAGNRWTVTPPNILSPHTATLVLTLCVTCLLPTRNRLSATSLLRVTR